MSCLQVQLSADEDRKRGLLLWPGPTARQPSLEALTLHNLKWVSRRAGRHLAPETLEDLVGRARIPPDSDAGVWLTALVRLFAGDEDIMSHEQWEVSGARATACLRASLLQLALDAGAERAPPKAAMEGPQLRKRRAQEVGGKICMRSPMYRLYTPCRLIHRSMLEWCECCLNSDKPHACWNALPVTCTPDCFQLGMVVDELLAMLFQCAILQCPGAPQQCKACKSLGLASVRDFATWCRRRLARQPTATA